MTQPSTEQEKLLDLERLVPLCDAIRKGAEYGTALAQATSEIKTAESLPERLRRIEPTVKMLVGTQHLPATELKTELVTLTKTGRALEKCVDAETLKDARFSVREARQSLERIEGVVAKAWAARIRAEFSPLQRLGQVLAEIVDTNAAGRELQTWAEKVLALCGSSPPSTESLEQLNAAKAELVERLDRLGKLGIDASVRNFLVDVAGNEATLKNLTPEVLAWLHARRAESRFRIELL